MLNDALAITFEVPALAPADGEAIAHDHYGIAATATPLPGERDRNFLLSTGTGARYVLKVSHAGEARALLELQNQVLDHLAAQAPELRLSRVVRSLAGAGIVEQTGPTGARHFVRLLTWVGGRMMADVAPHDITLLESLGETLGTIDRALSGFTHPAARRALKWDLAAAGWIRPHISTVADPPRRALVERLFAPYDREVVPALGRLRRSIIYNDANDHNVVVDATGPWPHRVAGVIDFGDLLESITVAEPTIGAAYAMLGKPDPLAAAAAVVAGYHRLHPLLDEEIALLYPLICARLCVSVVNAAIQRAAVPDNAYLTISERPAWELLERLDAVSPALAHYTFRAACGLEPCPSTPHIVAWLERAGATMGPLLQPDPRNAPVVRFDLGIGTLEWDTLDEIRDQAVLGPKLFERMRAAGAPVGIGCYDEARAIYTDDRFRQESNDGPVWRTVHLGLDLFAEAGAPVLAPLDGVVHSVHDNQGAGDYGPTIILQHDADGLPWYSLYGHLSRADLAGLLPRQRVPAGMTIAHLGTAAENGGWPPHLHFQVITDLLGRTVEFPGVARADQRAVWLAVSPDPNLVARIPGGVRARSVPPTTVLLRHRQEHLGPSLSISYRRPLTIVRGFLQHLFDADGRAYLDAVNNVPHVGHCHPRVVRAGRAQAATLNTNTRYLHEGILRLADRLSVMLPDPLRVCFFVNSGSEANELALRMARAYTGRRGMIPVDVGYHGNTSALIDISPYKHDGPGGEGPPPWVQKVPIPDDYRGAFRRGDPDAGPKFAASLSEAAGALTARGFPPAAFICESVLSCGGQVVLPPNYLREAYRLARAAGAVCIADEVQVGFGRVGTHYWGFETQGVVPDIVTMGKPIGNGHPLGAVVTTPEIAAAFANGMEYFSTFGGNPVSCAIGLAVMDVIADGELQAHSLAVGDHLMAGLRELMTRHETLGDVRGLGLFVGAELVRNRQTLEPAETEASYAANRMRDLGVLVSTDGPFHNVLKIKPPLVFSRDDADTLVVALDRVLGEDTMRAR
jgi:4-aminobutyrate aminotransferase-like enzyme/Ser/Thr protein kinase RdoA (MazF antagonist)